MTLAARLLAIMPARIGRLPRDARGFPIPQAVKRDADGTPHLAIIDPARAAALHETHSCEICGEKLLRLENWFVGAPGDVRQYGWGFSRIRQCIASASPSPCALAPTWPLSLPQATPAAGGVRGPHDPALSIRCGGPLAQRRPLPPILRPVSLAASAVVAGRS